MMLMNKCMYDANDNHDYNDNSSDVIIIIITITNKISNDNSRVMITADPGDLLITSLRTECPSWFIQSMQISDIRL